MASRVSHEPGFVLHRYDWSESSLVLEVFTRDHGRIALVAKGAKRPSSNFRPVLLPLQPLSLSWSGDAEIRTLKGAEWSGGQVMPTGDALLSGYHVNELLMRLLARDDPHERLFDAYAQLVRLLSGAWSEPRAAGTADEARAQAGEAALRAFELILLREVGVLPALDAQTANLAAVTAGGRYLLSAEGGLRVVATEEPAGLKGSHWLALQAALDAAAPLMATMRACADCNGELKPQLRALLHYHCGVPVLKTRQMLIDIRSL